MKLLSTRTARLSVAIKVLDNDAPEINLSSMTEVEIPGINAACHLRSARYHLFEDVPGAAYIATISGKGYQTRTVTIVPSELDPKFPVVEVRMVRV